MTQLEVNEAVARATGEPLDVVGQVGFQLADPLVVHYDPEPRRPLVLDWDSMSPDEWPG
jgi:hypothetical protein